MSVRERDRLVVLRPVLSGSRTTLEAAQLLGMSSRQVRRLLARVREKGDAGLVHGLRGRPSNRRGDDALRRRVVLRYRESFGDYGPTLASERLMEEGLVVNAQTLRRWLMREGLWVRHRKREKHRIRRARRRCVGEMLQIDGSHHDWLEGRGKERLVLVAFIDDATSRVFARFYDGETTEAYFDLFSRYVRASGLPGSLYTDRAGIFRTERKKRETDVEESPHFTRAMEELGVRMLMAHSPQAKGRVERLFGTLQDRWVKALREARVNTREEANELIEKRLQEEFNERFTVTPTDTSDGHRPSPPKAILEATLCVQCKRIVANDYTVRHGKKLYQIVPPLTSGLRGGTVIVVERRSGEVQLRFREKYLRWTPALRPLPTPG